MAETLLHAFMQDQLANGKALVRVLESEALALTQRDAEAIEQLAAEKQRLTGALVEQAKSMTELLPKADADGHESELSPLDESDSILSGLWDEIQSVLAQANALNQVNGRTVELSLNHVTRTLRILTTGTDKPQNHVYSASGKVDAGINRTQRVITV